VVDGFENALIAVVEPLVRRGLVTRAGKTRTEKRARVKPRGSVSELVAEQRR
jgi:hypothetical protein